MPRGAKILLTGGNGFLGRALTPGLSVTYDLYTLGKSDQNNYSCNLASEPPTFDQAFDLVIHTAGKAHAPARSELAKEEFFQVNLHGSKNLALGLESCPNPPKILIFISSVAVYGLDSGSGIRVFEEVRATTPYARSKLMAEEFLRQWCRERGISLTVLRLPLIVGPRPPGNLKALIAAIEKGRYFRIGNGSARKSVVWAEDILSILPFLPGKTGTYILTDGCHPSLKELEDAVARSFNNRMVPSIPFQLAQLLAKVGDLIGKSFPFNSEIMKKLNSTLTFSDIEARQELNWNPTPVLSKIDETVSN